MNLEDIKFVVIKGDHHPSEDELKRDHDVYNLDIESLNKGLVKFIRSQDSETVNLMGDLFYLIEIILLRRQ